MNLYMLKREHMSEPIYFLASSYKEAENLCQAKYPELPNQEIKFVSDKILSNLSLERV